MNHRHKCTTQNHKTSRRNTENIFAPWGRHRLLWQKTKSTNYNDIKLINWTSSKFKTLGSLKKIDKPLRKSISYRQGKKYWPNTYLTKDLYLEISSHTEKGTIKTQIANKKTNNELVKSLNYRLIYGDTVLLLSSAYANLRKF